MNTNNLMPLDPRDQNPDRQPVNSEDNQQDITNTETDWELTADEEKNLQDEDDQAEAED